MHPPGPSFGPSQDRRPARLASVGTLPVTRRPATGNTRPIHRRRGRPSHQAAIKPTFAANYPLAAFHFKCAGPRNCTPLLRRPPMPPWSSASAMPASAPCRVIFQSAPGSGHDPPEMACRSARIGSLGPRKNSLCKFAIRRQTACRQPPHSVIIVLLLGRRRSEVNAPARPWKDDRLSPRCGPARLP